MIKYVTGDLLDDKAEAIVNTVNCVGVMGRGVALQFKKKFPENYKVYAAACKQDEVVPGKMFVSRNEDMFGPDWIINFPTKRHWRQKSRIEDIETGLDSLVKVIEEKQIKSIALPPLGSGLGGLDWQQVKALIVSKLNHLTSVEIRIYEPSNIANSKAIAEQDEPNMTAGRAALVGLIDRYLKGLLDPTVSLLEVHKLMFFLQEAGEPLRLNYQKASYGPYADNLRHVLNKIEGHFITGYQDGGDAPDKQIELMPSVTTEANNLLQSNLNTQHYFKRVVQLVEGFESAFGLELLATVYWVIKKEGAESFEGIKEKVHTWSERKKQFSEQQLQVAYQRLQKQSWV